jgi:translation initiation factor IF-3
LIGPDGSQLGIKPVPEALRMARGLDLDLVEVAPMANPPVCRIMDYGKFRYEEAQKAKEARRKSIHVTVKEVKFRPKIGRGDFDTKMRHLKEFLEEGHKVKVTLQFRGREVAHPELGRKILDDVILALGPTAKVENQARMEGRNMTLVLAPDKKAQDALRKAAEAERNPTVADAEPDEVSTTFSETNEVETNEVETHEGETNEAETHEDHEPTGDEIADPAEASVASEAATPQTVGDE